MKRRGIIEIHRPVVWVTGASRGIGKEIAKQFASIGCEVCLSSRSERELQSVKKEIVQLGGHAHVFRCDISNLKSIQNTAQSIKRQIGNVDVLINNAGITVFKSFSNTSLIEFNDIIQTNLIGQVACIKSVLPSMVKRKGGWIFNILSNAAVKTFEGSSAYTTAKSGMRGFGKVLREEMRNSNVKVVSVLPGPVETEMWSVSSRKKLSYRMMSAKSVAESVLSVYQMPDDVVVDEIRIRPMLGDID